MFRPLFMLALISASISGCATMDDSPYKRSDGWREGEIVEVGSSEKLEKKTVNDCRKAPEDKTVANIYATAWYKKQGHSRYRIVPVPKDMSVKEGDLVYVNVDSCANALVARPNR